MKTLTRNIIISVCWLAASASNPAYAASHPLLPVNGPLAKDGRAVQFTPASGVRYAVVFDLKDKEPMFTIGYKTFGVESLFGKKGFDLEAWTLAGYGAVSGVGSVGGGIVFPYRIAPKATAYIGGAYRFSKEGRGFGLIAGFKLDF